VNRYTVRIVQVVEEVYDVEVEADSYGSAVDEAIDKLTTEIAMDNCDLKAVRTTLDFDVTSVKKGNEQRGQDVQS